MLEMALGVEQIRPHGRTSALRALFADGPSDPAFLSSGLRIFLPRGRLWRSVDGTRPITRNERGKSENRYPRMDEKEQLPEIEAFLE
jgi:hypothetical protein